MKRSIRTGTYFFKPAWIVSMVVAVILVLSVAATGRTAGGEPKDVVARWGDAVITNEDLDIRIKGYPPELQEQLKDPGQRKQYVESLIQVLIAGAAAREMNLDKDRDIAVRIEDMTNSILLQEYINRKIAALTPPSDKDIEAFYEARKNEYLTPVFIRAQHILIECKPDATPARLKAAEAKAQKVHKELVAGADFSKLAAKYSDDTETKATGGDLGLFQAEQMVPEFSGPVFGMKKGELSKPFKTPFGFHIVRVTDLLPAKQMALQDVRDDVAMRLDNQNREAFVSSEMERLKAKYKVEVY
ncbi:MAG: peptidylprolyl isomerase [Smithellaceae bacterium]